MRCWYFIIQLPRNTLSLCWFVGHCLINTCYWEFMHLHVSADNLELLLDIHDLLLRNLDNVRMGSLSLFLSLASYGFVSTYGLCSAVLTSRISIVIISSVFICQIWTSALSLPLVASASRVASFLKISLKFVLGRGCWVMLMTMIRMMLRRAWKTNLEMSSNLLSEAAKVNLDSASCLSRLSIDSSLETSPFSSSVRFRTCAFTTGQRLSLILAQHDWS